MAKQWPKFTYSEQVQALKIADIRVHPQDPTMREVSFTEKGMPAIKVDPAWIAAQKAVPGGWYVLRADGSKVFVDDSKFRRTHKGA